MPMGPTGPHNGQRTTSPRPRKLSAFEQSELSERLATLAEVFGETLTAARIDLYVEYLSDLPFDRLRAALLAAPLKLRFFPKIVELRELAGIEAGEDAVAEAAWILMVRYIQEHYHPDLGIHGYWSGGVYHAPPKLDERSAIALRACGGPSRLCAAVNSENDESEYGWVKKEFLASWKRAPAIEHALGQEPALEPAEILKRLTEGRD